MKRNFMLLFLCVMLAVISTLAACKGTEGTTPDEVITSSTETTQNTTVVTEADTTATTATSEATNPESIQQEDAPVTKPVDRDEKPKYATVSVGGTDYTVKVGDRIIYTCYLKTPSAIENIQASVTYDDTALWFRQTSSKEMFPTTSGTIYNTNVTGSVLFNASEPIDGFDFTGNSTLVQLEFDVAKEGYSAIATAIEFMDELGGNPYINNFDIIGNITITETLS